MYKGSNWASLTQRFVTYLCLNEDVIKKEFKRTHCSDEIYKQTIAMANNFKLSKYGNLRLVNFKRGNGKNPYTFKDSDYLFLKDTNALFARKFSSKDSALLVDRLTIDILP